MASTHFDVIIVGAGLSGIGAAHHLQQGCPDKSYTILEGRDAIGGTWDLFRYPGIRSDSDMYTLGYSFRPWRDGKAIADGPSILDYVRNTAAEGGIDRHIRFQHWVTRYDWSSADATWTVTAKNGKTGKTVRLTASFVLNCSGYYRYDAGYMPDFPGIDRFAGQVIHPQHWPEDLDYAGKRVVVIGSGATAVTLVPAMAGTAADVTMLQRSPTYIVSLPDVDAIAQWLKRLLPAKAAYQLTRWKNVSLQTLFYQACRRYPKLMRRILRQHLKTQLGRDFDVDTHFNPSYNPWDQRLCLVPNGDLFRALRRGDAHVVTDHIETFTETGVRLQSGQTLEADIVVSATGLNLVALGGAELSVDGRTLTPNETMGFKGMMLSNVPNLAMVVGYTNASWTLKADLTAEYVCRLLQHMDRHGYDACTPVVDGDVAEEPFLDLDAGYVRRALEQLPKQGDRKPWRLYQNYLLDLLHLRFGKVNDPALHFDRVDAGERVSAQQA
ncbi:flavin-containing monooxygenase [Marinobacter sp. JSM 1782161]|uniref:flavin-containing monooxygenase n=1 Tax=Marinobacter sp. JSM 1782161 TaxID=2685906 RepID=UPI0014041AFF|nr:NAD(P)/FAD-dependent oxidoreductase [Marinobacter sp. JSM 1782161]